MKAAVHTNPVICSNTHESKDFQMRTRIQWLEVSTLSVQHCPFNTVPSMAYVIFVLPVSNSVQGVFFKPQEASDVLLVWG